MLCRPPELYYDRGSQQEFTSLVKELARPGELTQSTSFDFDFARVEKPYETYTGANVRLRSAGASLGQLAGNCVGCA